MAVCSSPPSFVPCAAGPEGKNTIAPLDRCTLAGVQQQSACDAAQTDGRNWAAAAADFAGSVRQQLDGWSCASQAGAGVWVRMSGCLRQHPRTPTTQCRSPDDQCALNVMFHMHVDLLPGWQLFCVCVLLWHQQRMLSSKQPAKFDLCGGCQMHLLCRWYCA